MSFKGRRRGMEVELAPEKMTACATHFSGGSATCANQPCTVQKADFLWVNSAPHSVSACYSIFFVLQCSAALFLVSLYVAVLNATCGQGGNDFCRARWQIM
jgi:hypothetical protein